MDYMAIAKYSFLMISLLTVFQSMTNNLVLGQPINLNEGLKHGISDGSLLYPKPTIFTDPSNSVTKGSGKFESYAHLDFCDNYTELVQTFFDYISISEGLEAGGFMTKPGESSAELADLIGVQHESFEGLSFVLARQWKKIKSVSTKQDLPDIDSSLNKNINSHSASDSSYLDVMDTYGTHFLSKYTTGDFIYQLFAYDKDEYELVKKTFPPGGRHGFDVNYYFPRYAQPKGEYDGHSKYYSPVKIASAHPRFNSEIFPHLQDSAYNLKSSIFQIPMKEAGIFGALNSIKSETIVGMNLRSLGSYIKDEKLSKKWRDLVENILFVKYGIMVKPKFTLNELPFDYATAYAHFTPLYPTTIPTYFLGLKSLHMDLISAEQIMQPHFVKTTLIFADTIEASSDVSIPGNVKVVIICNNFLSKSEGSFVPKISLSVDPKDSDAFKLYARNFLGTLQVENHDSSSQLTIYNGNRLLSQPSQNKVQFEANFFQKLPHLKEASLLYSGESGGKLMRDSFKDGLNLFVVSIENILNYNMGEETPFAAYQFCNWIVATLKSSGTAVVQKSGLGNTFGNLYVRALTLQKTRNPDQGHFDPPVPYLSYFMYKEAIEALCSVAEEYARKMDHIEELIYEKMKFEEMAKNQNTMNNNIRNMAKFLVEQNNAMADNQDDFVKYYDQLIKKKMSILRTVLELEDKYSDQLYEQQINVERTGNELIVAMENRAGFEIFKALVDGVAGMFTGNAISKLPELKNMMEALMKIRNALKALDAFNRLMKSIEDGDLEKAGQALNKIDSENAKSAFPTELDWKRFDLNVEEITGRVDIPKSHSFDKEAHLFTATGRQFVGTAKKIVLLQYDIAVYTLKKAIYAKHKKRMKDISNIMDQKSITTEEAMNIDLFALGTFLRVGQGTVLMELLTVMLEQNGALRYHALQTPTIPTAYDILSVKHAIASNEMSSLDSYNAYNPPPHEIEELKEVVIQNVPYKNLAGAGYSFELDPDQVDVLYPFARVRVTEVQAYVSDVKTSTGKIYVRVSGGESFEDRDLDRKIVKFTTIPHVYPFVFYTRDMTIAEGNRLMGRDLTTFSLLTPFTTWNIRLPPNAKENLGMQNSKTEVTVTLKFRIFAVRKDGRL